MLLKFRKRIRIALIFSVLLIPTFVLFNVLPNQNESSETNPNFNRNSFSKFKTSATPNRVYVDPRIEELMHDSSTYSDRLDVLLFFNYKIHDYSDLSRLGTIKNKYSLINGCKFETSLQYINNLCSLPHIQSIWWDTPIVLPKSEKEADKIPQNIREPLLYSNENSFVNFTEEIHAQQLWKEDITGKGIVIAILDSGVDISGSGGGDLDDLDDNSSTSDPKFLGGVSMVPDEPLYYTDLTGRGTFHAGIACGTGRINSNYIGVAPGANYLNVKIFDSLGITYWSFMISGIEWSIEHGADVILFVSTIPGFYLDPVSQMVNAAVDRGVIVVAPVGDDGPSYMSINTPAQANHALSVGAYDSTTQTVWSHSSRGPSYDFHVGPDIIAPGVNLIGPRARYLTNESVNLAINFISQLSPEMSLALSSQMNGLQQELFMISDSIPKSQFGNPLSPESNYTRASGTGAAAAVCAGGIALLLEAFPLATPVMIQQALQRGAHTISQSSDINIEGSGLIDLWASFQWMRDIFGEQTQKLKSSSVPLFYSGIVTNKDLNNVSQYSIDLNYSNLENYDSAVMVSSQLMSTALLVSDLNESDPLDVQNLAFHFPLNQFGITYEISSNSDSREFHWFSEFNVVKELHEMVNSIVYPDGYRRYVSVLEYDGLYVACEIESWAYLGEFSDEISTFNFTSPLTHESYYTSLNFTTLSLNHRLNAYKISFHFINDRSDHQNLDNISLISFMKADLFANETGILGSFNYKKDGGINFGDGGDNGDISDFIQDDAVQFDPSTQMIWVEDLDNSSLDTGDPNYNAMGFTSYSHNLSAFSLGDSFNLLVNISQHPFSPTTWNFSLSESANYSSFNSSNSHCDPSFAQQYFLDNLTYGGTLEFNGALSVSEASTLQECRNKVRQNAFLLQSNTTKYNITDLLILSSNFARIHEPDVPYKSQVKILNMGTKTPPNTQLVFYANRTLSSGEVEMFSRIFSVPNLKPFQLKAYTASWIPLAPGIYQIGWIIGDLDEFISNPSITDLEYLLQQNPEITEYRQITDNMDVNYLSNLLFRNIFVIDSSILESRKIDTFMVSPYKLDCAPMNVFTPLDYGIYNLSILAFRDINNVEVSTDGLGSKVLQFLHFSPNQTSSSLTSTSRILDLHPYSSISLLLFGNPFIPPGELQFNITFRLLSQRIPFYSIPVVIHLVSTRGRVWFDATHLNFFPSEKITSLESLTSYGTINTSNFSAVESFGSFNDLLSDDFDLSSFIDLTERLDTTWGNFHDLRSLWANPSTLYGKGALVSTILPFLELNISSFFDFSQYSLSNPDGVDSNNSNHSNNNTNDSSDYFFDTQDLFPETSFLGNSIGNYKFENEILSTSTINHDLLQFFDVLVLNDPEQAFTQEEMDDIYEWVQAGGTLFVWSEDFQHTNLPSLNQLLDEFGLKFANNTFYPYASYSKLENNDGLCHLEFSAKDKSTSLFQSAQISSHSIALKDPLEVFASKPSAQILGYKTMFDGEHGLIGLANYGHGKVLAIGDNDIFKPSYLQRDDNLQFTRQILQWGLSNYYQMGIEISSSIIPVSSQAYIDISFSNYDQLQNSQLFSSGFLFTSVYFNDKGDLVNASLYNIKTPLLPLFSTEPGHYATYFDTKWVDDLGTYYILIIIDHPAGASELTYLPLSVVLGPVNPHIIQYRIPHPPYPHFIDIIGVFGIVVLLSGLYFYNQQKNKTRLQIIPLQGDYLNLAKTRLYEGETLFKLMLQGINKTDVEEIERIRFLLSNQRRVIKFFKDLNQFGETIGEHY